MFRDKESVLNWLESYMGGCTTPAYITDAQGINGAYCACYTEEFFNGDKYNYLSGEDWQFKGTERADTEEVDLDIWCQEFDNKEAVDALRETMGNGNLYIAHFEKENGEEMEDILLISCKMRSSREEN